MWLVLLALVPSLCPAEVPAPDRQQVRAGTIELEKAFQSGTAGDRVRAITAHGRLADAVVVGWVGKGLRDDELEVRKSAIEALRWNDLDLARSSLHALVEQDRSLRDQPTLYAAALRAIAQHSDAASIGVLSDDPWSVPDPLVLQARILGLGRIRSPAAVEALFGLMKIAGRHKIQLLMEDFRLALCVLTGADQGESQDRWIAWWNEQRGKVRVAPEIGELPKPMQARWSRYWNEGDRDTRSPRRGEGRGVR